MPPGVVVTKYHLSFPIFTLEMKTVKMEKPMKVVFSEAFYPCYVEDAAAVEGRMESIVGVIRDKVMFIEADSASENDILAVHSLEHVERVKRIGLYEIASLAAGGAIQTAMISLGEPAFGLIRPPGHHASEFVSWGYCYFNNMAIAVAKLKNEGLIDTCLILDIDLHYGDGTVNILGDKNWVEIHNPAGRTRGNYLKDVENSLMNFHADMIGISAGFDNHKRDWGGLLETEDYKTIGQMVRDTCRQSGSSYFALLEGGYSKKVLGYNVEALIEGME
jgi:acetoin utilization deacetylase AcuC-like enzyme